MTLWNYVVTYCKLYVIFKIVCFCGFSLPWKWKISRHEAVWQYCRKERFLIHDTLCLIFFSHKSSTVSSNFQFYCLTVLQLSITNSNLIFLYVNYMTLPYIHGIIWIGFLDLLFYWIIQCIVVPWIRTLWRKFCLGKTILSSIQSIIVCWDNGYIWKEC